MATSIFGRVTILQAKWRGTWEFDGGALMNQTSHYVDLAYRTGREASMHYKYNTSD